MTTPTRDQVLRAPKVLLHDHLDGGLRPQTIVELAAEIGHAAARPPTPRRSAAGSRESADSGSLERYLETFDHTVAVMQTGRALDPGRPRVRRGPGRRRRRLRRGPLRPRAAPRRRAHPRRGRRGGAGRASRQGMAAAGGRIVVRQLLTAMRHAGPVAARSPSSPWPSATAASAGFDIAGAEAGFPPTRHLDAFEYLQRENAHFTIHAGEAFGLPSIWEAIQWCGADRLGHGVRIIDDITVRRRRQRRRWAGSRRTCATSASRWRCARRSNVQTGAADVHRRRTRSALLTRLRFRVTVNTDNRLMSGTSMTDEMAALVEAFGYDLEDLRWFTINAMKSAFLPFDERLAIIERRDQAGVRRARWRHGEPRAVPAGQRQPSRRRAPPGVRRPATRRGLVDPQHPVARPPPATRTTWRGDHRFPRYSGPAPRASPPTMSSYAESRPPRSSRTSCSTPVVPSSWCATAHGGVPSARGHGSWSRPRTVHR